MMTGHLGDTCTTYIMMPFDLESKKSIPRAFRFCMLQLTLMRLAAGSSLRFVRVKRLSSIGSGGLLGFTAACLARTSLL